MWGLFSMRRGQRRKQGRHYGVPQVIVVQRDPVLLQRLDDIGAELADVRERLNAYESAWALMHPRHPQPGLHLVKSGSRAG